MRTSERLASALYEADAPPEMIRKAKAGHYDDYLSPLAMPIMALVNDARAVGLENIAQRAIAGEFDGTKEESEAWAQSEEGQQAFRELFGGAP